MTAHTVVPVQVTSGAVHATETEAPSPAVLVHGAPIADPAEALRNPHAAEVNRLNTFLMQSFPREMQRTNLVTPESPVDVAIRLLRGLTATGVYARCSTQYCNLPVDHDGEHGFVQFSPHAG